MTWLVYGHQNGETWRAGVFVTEAEAIAKAAWWNGGLCIFTVEEQDA